MDLDLDLDLDFRFGFHIWIWIWIWIWTWIWIWIWISDLGLDFRFGPGSIQAWIDPGLDRSRPGPVQAWTRDASRVWRFWGSAGRGMPVVFGRFWGVPDSDTIRVWLSWPDFFRIPVVFGQVSPKLGAERTNLGSERRFKEPKAWPGRFRGPNRKKPRETQKNLRKPRKT